jgi:signal transduction histidine kinase
MTARIREMLRSKEQLLLDVSHELRSPLTRAKLGLALIDDNENVRRVNEDLKELEQMITELLEAARLESDFGVLRRELTDLAILAREVSHGRRVSVVTPGAVTINVDPDRISTVLRNLVDNALKYSAEGTPVDLRVMRADNGGRIEVRDHGVGIPPGELAHVFEPFYRVDKSRTRKTGGFGLGLSLCKRIVEAHGGTISISSEPKVGTTVTVFLPDFH